MIVHVTHCDYEEHGISALCYELIDPNRGVVTKSKQFCEGSYNKEIAASVVDLLTKETTAAQIILSAEGFNTQKEKIFKIINRSSSFHIDESGKVSKQ